MNYYEQIEKIGLLSKGKKSLLKHLDKGKLSRKEAMDAKCYDCMAWFADGRMDCKMPKCPLFDYRPYKDVENVPKNPNRQAAGLKNASKGANG